MVNSRVTLHPAGHLMGHLEGCGANFIKCMFLAGEKSLQILGGQDYGPNFRSGGCFSC
jgi:hypothetical protein